MRGNWEKMRSYICIFDLLAKDVAFPVSMKSFLLLTRHL